MVVLKGLQTPLALLIRVSKKDREPLYEPPTTISPYFGLKAMQQSGEGAKSVFSGKFGSFRFQM